MTVATFVTASFGANPRSVDGPFVPGSGTILPQFKLGSVVQADGGGEFLYVSFTPASNLTLSEGQVMQYDFNYAASLLTTANAIRGANVGVVRVSPAQAVLSGQTYWLWLQRAGIAPTVATSNATANNLAETTATAGVLHAPASPTVSSKLVTGLYYAVANVAFVGTTVSGSNQVTGVNLSGLTAGLFVGQGVSGTGIAGGSTITAIAAGQNATFPVGAAPLSGTSVTNATITLSANATASGSPTITANGVLEAYVNWPYIDKTN